MTTRPPRTRLLLLWGFGIGFALQFAVALRTQPFSSDSFHYMEFAGHLSQARIWGASAASTPTSRGFRSIEDPNDLERLPLMEPFRSHEPPTGFRLLYRLDRPDVGYVKFFAIEPAP